MVTQALYGRTRGKYDSQHRIPGCLTEPIAFSHMIHIITFSVAAIKIPTTTTTKKLVEGRVCFDSQFRMVSNS